MRVPVEARPVVEEFKEVLEKRQPPPVPKSKPRNKKPPTERKVLEEEFSTANAKLQRVLGEWSDLRTTVLMDGEDEVTDHQYVAKTKELHDAHRSYKALLQKVVQLEFDEEERKSRA